MEHKITTSKIIQAAKTCKKAKRTLGNIIPRSLRERKTFL